MIEGICAGGFGLLRAYRKLEFKKWESVYLSKEREQASLGVGVIKKVFIARPIIYLSSQQ